MLGPENVKTKTNRCWGRVCFCSSLRSRLFKSEWNRETLTCAVSSVRKMSSLCIWLDRLPNWLRTNFGCRQAGVRRQSERSPARCWRRLMDQPDAHCRRWHWCDTSSAESLRSKRQTAGLLNQSGYNCLLYSVWENRLNGIGCSACSGSGVFNKAGNILCIKSLLTHDHITLNSPHQRFPYPHTNAIKMVSFRRHFRLLFSK